MRRVLLRPGGAGVAPRFLSFWTVCSFLRSTKASTFYVGCAEMHRTKGAPIYGGAGGRKAD